MHDRVQRLFHEHRLIEHDARCQLLRQIEQMLRQRTHVVHYLDRVGVAALLHDRDVGRFLPVDPDDVVLQLARILRLCHVAQRHPALAHRFHRNAVEVFDILYEAVRINVVIVRPDLHIARGQNQIAAG